MTAVTLTSVRQDSFILLHLQYSVYYLPSPAKVMHFKEKYCQNNFTPVNLNEKLKIVQFSKIIKKSYKNASILISVGSNICCYYIAEVVRRL